MAPGEARGEVDEGCGEFGEKADDGTGGGRRNRGQDERRVLEGGHSSCSGRERRRSVGCEVRRGAETDGGRG